jgi:hypothetical protein
MKWVVCVLFVLFSVSCSSQPKGGTPLDPATGEEILMYQNASIEASDAVDAVMNASGIPMSAGYGNLLKSFKGLPRASMTFSTNVTITGWSGSIDGALSMTMSDSATSLTVDLTMNFTFNNYFYLNTSQGLDGTLAVNGHITMSDSQMSTGMTEIANLTWGTNNINWHINTTATEYSNGNYSGSASGTIYNHSFSTNWSGTYQ